LQEETSEHLPRVAQAQQKGRTRPDHLATSVDDIVSAFAAQVNLEGNICRARCFRKQTK
jgi:hypothetical protein